MDHPAFDEKELKIVAGDRNTLLTKIRSKLAEHRCKCRIISLYLPSDTATACEPATLASHLRKQRSGRFDAPDKDEEETMLRRMGLAVMATLMIAGAAYADPIEGNWKTESGETAAIGGCGSGFCITLKTGEHAGKTIGQMTASGDGRYAGSITKPQNNKTYSGKATLSGNSLKLSGCVLGGLICESQTWSRL